MQDQKLGIASFIECGVRSSLIPVLISYLQDRKMTVRYRREESSEKSLPGGGAQGTLLGPIEYWTQSNKNADAVSQDKRFKFVDDLTTIEVISLVTKVVSYNFRQHVASDVGIHNQFISREKTETQSVVDSVNNWTNNQKMKLNGSKTKYMIVNFTYNYQFNTRIFLDNEILDCIEQIRLLGVEFREDLSWKANTHSITRKAFARMSLLRKLVCFGVPREDLVNIYILFIRSLLEYCSEVWHSSITEEEVQDLERVQKCAVRIVMNNDYEDYEKMLKELNLEELKVRREQICLDFAKKCVLNPKTSNWFPKNPPTDHSIRNPNEFLEMFASTERLRMSTIPYLQRLLNTEGAKQT